MRSITCRCEKTFEADLPEEIDIDVEKGTVAGIIAGTFFTISCPHCGLTLKPELQVRMFSRKLHIDVYAVPETHRTSYYRGNVDIPNGSEVVIGFPELYERACIISDSLDPSTIEILKYHLLAKAMLGAPEESEVFVYYKSRDNNGRLNFAIHGLRPGEIAMIPLGFDRYEKALSEKKSTMSLEPFTRIFAGSYRSVRSLEMDNN